jgi:dTDP-glucose 4,6-dehydratase
MRILLTGGAGFIGHHVAEHFLRNTDAEIVFLDRLDTSGNLNRISQSDNWEKHRTRCRFIHHDLRAPVNGIVRHQVGKFNVILHLAASTHIDRSITDPVPFVYDNVVGTANILELARETDGLDQFIQFSTDEVFGPAPLGTLHRETDRFAPGNPYSATKAGAELLTLAYHNTYHLPVKVVHVMNVFGERQHPEKFVPLVMAKILRGETVNIHSAPDMKTIGSRFYIHARNVAAAVQFVMERGTVGESYNVVGEREVDNLDMARLVSHHMGIGLNYEMTNFHATRPGHDLRYALDGSKMAAMGWRLPVTFETSLEKTVRWTMAHREWLGG